MIDKAGNSPGLFCFPCRCGCVKVNAMSKAATAELTVCECQQCGGRIEFDGSALPADGQVVECPHCQADTRLRVARPSIAQKINPRITGKALETKLDETADGFFAIAVFGVVCAVVVALFLADANALGSAVLLLISVGFSLFLVGALRTFFHALAELIRLEKDQAHFHFEGRITGQKSFTCSVCKAGVQDGEARCPSCGSAF